MENEKIKEIVWFSGYGGSVFAMKKANINHEVVGYSEINKYAIDCFKQNHGEELINLGDISEVKLKDIPEADLWSVGSPCQDFSIAGNRDLTKGKSLLINYIFKFAAIKKPKYIIFENVKGLVSTEPFFTNMKWTLKKLGYDIRYKVLNSKHHGNPQNRERIFILCNRDGFEPFKQIFPNKKPLKLFVDDLFEKNVDVKYYLTEKQFVSMTRQLKRRDKKLSQNLDKHISHCLTAHEPSRALHDSMIIHNMMPRSGDPKKGGTGHLSKKDGSSYSLTTNKDQVIEYDNNFRYLTTTEYFRLQGFWNDEIKTEGISNCQKYKLAGNGWDINLVSQIYKLWLESYIVKTPSTTFSKR